MTVSQKWCKFEMFGREWNTNKLLSYRNNTGQQQYFYIMENHGGDYKIGISMNPKSRLKTINAANSRPVKLIYVSEIKHCAMATLEKEYHDILKSHGTHLQGEWFDLSDEMLENVYEWLKEDMANLKAAPIKDYNYYQDNRQSIIDKYIELDWFPSRYAAA